MKRTTIDDDIETSERSYGRLHSRLSSALIRHVECSSPDLITIFLCQIFEAAGIAGGCNESIARCKHSFSDVPA